MSELLTLKWKGEDTTRIRIERGGSKVEIKKDEKIKVERKLAEIYEAQDKRFEIVEFEKKIKKAIPDKIQKG